MDQFVREAIAQAVARAEEGLVKEEAAPGPAHLGGPAPSGPGWTRKNAVLVPDWGQLTKRKI